MTIRGSSPAACPVPALFIVLLFIGLVGCIERPTSVREKRTTFERSHLEDVVLTRLPAVTSQRVGAVFGDAVELASVELSPASAHPGDTVRVTFYFLVRSEAEEEYKIFVHVDDRAHGDRINGDHWPAGGRYPTHVWRKGEIIKDVWSFSIPSSFRGDVLDLWAGFYQPSKEDRWPVTSRGEVQNDGQNRVLAATLPVR